MAVEMVWSPRPRMVAMRILITGVTGFVGCHLARQLGAIPGVHLYGLSRSGRWPTSSRDLESIVTLFQADLLDAPRIRTILEEVLPDQVYHLAGFADVARSFTEPETAWEQNVTATRSLYDAVSQTVATPRILYVGSGAVYGDGAEADTELTETSEFRPNSPYAVSKAAGDLLSYQYTRTHHLEIVRVRPFNHVGPGQSDRFALPNFARQIARIERSELPPVLRVGNLWTERDFTDVRDVVRAYRLLIERGKAGEAYNLASGKSVPMRHLLQEMLSMSSARIRVETDAALVRTVETRTVRVRPRRLHEATGWLPRISLKTTLADLLESFRAEARQTALLPHEANMEHPRRHRSSA